jgi:hypothetical protein
MKKGAVELSLSFIVMVVFAVILLSLAIVWLQGVIGSIGGLTTDLTQQSASKIQEIFGETGDNFAVWPSSYTLPAGKGIKLLSGIKNNARDSYDHRYVINVLPSTVSNEVCDSGDIDVCTVSGGTSLSDYMKTWLTFDKNKNPVKQGSSFSPWIEIKIPIDARKGTYMFSVFCCYDGENQQNAVPDYNECDNDVELSKLWGGSAKSIVLTVN